MTDLTPERIRVDALVPDPENARTHGRRNLAAIADSLRLFGQRKPIVVAPDGQTVVAGSGTLEAAVSLAWTELDAVRLPADWTPDQVRAFALADNRSGELASWDDVQLQSTLRDLDAAGWSVKDLGFDQGSLEVPVVDVDPAPPTEGETRTAPGQLWALDRFRGGRVSDHEPVLTALLMGGGMADCVLTDPYNVDYTGKTGDALKISNDAMTPAGFAAFLRDAFTLMASVTVPGGPCYVFHADTEGEAFRREFVASGWLFKECLVWVKDQFVMGRQDYHWQHEPILYGWRPGATHRWFGGRRQTTVVEHPRPHRNTAHPTMKPIGLVAYLLGNSTARGDVVLDPFGGSGSTLLACEQTGRVCRTMELDPRFADVILSRWEVHTGQVATLDGSR